MLEINVKNERQNRHLIHDGGPLEFGRLQQEGGKRFVIDDPYVSRDQVRIEETENGRVLIENLGGPLTLDKGAPIEKGETRTVALPISLNVGYTVIVIRGHGISHSPDKSLETIAPPTRNVQPRASVMQLGDAPTPDKLATWFETLLSVQRAAAGSAEFYEETARAVVELVGLDRGMVLLRAGNDGKQWEPRASYAATPDCDATFSYSVLSRVVELKRTFYEAPMGEAHAASLNKVEAYVAAPIFDSGDEVVGVVFGSRDLRDNVAHRGIKPLEAQIVQVLAAAVSAGLTRMDREAEVARIRVQYEQFVSPQLARELERNPNLLDAQERNVTVLFTDLRGFSRISERLAASDSYRLVSDVMDRLSNCILENDGYIIDFYGDGIAAVWNAPVSQHDHGDLACQTAVAMQQELPELNEKWANLIGTPLRIGVGINSGIAQVGNAGSRRRIKYGPRGHTVNLAARIEGATKELGVSILISDQTRKLLQQDFLTRRLCKVRVVGIDEVVQLYEVNWNRNDHDWVARRDVYNRALACFEAQQLDEASTILQGLGGTDARDRPTQTLALLVASKTRGSSVTFEPVLKLDTK